MISDEDLIEQFESCDLPGELFHHGMHVRVAWLYLRKYPLLEAVAAFSKSLKRYAASAGKEAIYHETITWAYLFIINERMARMAYEAKWEEFAEANPDLLDWKNSILKNYYTRERLESDLARKMFCMPERSARG
ncbi:MAG TPA: hypothetical protein VIG62_11060 [Blastocatellia bacterium]|jgi:hypothetical protein